LYRRLLDRGHPQACWERSVETLTARKDEITGLDVASDERIEAYVLCAPNCSPDASASGTGTILSLRSFVDDGGACLKQLVNRLRGKGPRTFGFPKVHSSELSADCREGLGFRSSGAHLIYAATARSE